MEFEIDGNYVFVAGFIILLILLVLATFVQPASAYTYVHQGDNISLGETYDLTGVYGWTGVLGWWKNSYKEGGISDPDIIIDLNDYFKVEDVYLDPTVWKLGNWYQWDGKGEETHGNTFVFKVTPQTNFTTTGKTSTSVKVNISKTPEPTMPPTIQPIQTPVPTPGPTPVIIPMRTLPPPRGLPTDPLVVAVAVIGGSLLFLWFREQ